MTTYAVIIPTLGRIFAAMNTVNRLFYGFRPPDEIVVVDQTDPDCQSATGRHLIKSIGSKGWCIWKQVHFKSLVRARNVGAGLSSADVLVFVDDDVFLNDDFLLCYERIFQDKTVDAATGMVLINEQDDGTFKPLLRMESKPTSASMLRGGNFAIRRNVYFTLGGSDENFLGASHHEDWDLAWRLHEADFRCVWDPDPWIYHLHLPTGGGRSCNANALWEYAFNVHYFYFRHPQAIGGTSRQIWRTLRQFLANRSSVLHPWQYPHRIATLSSAINAAASAAKTGPRLPFSSHL